MLVATTEKADWHRGRTKVTTRSMHADARLLVAERVVGPGAHGSEAKLFDINMLVTVGGLERSAAEYAALLEAAGLRLGQVLPTASTLSVLEALPAV